MLLENLLILQIFIKLSFILLNYFDYIVLLIIMILIKKEANYELYNKKIF